jgi:LysR family transcriptional regulator, regulator of abg operon
MNAESRYLFRGDNCSDSPVPMKNHQIRAFVQVAESGTIRAAARAMHLSQSALTKSLRELEEDVGAELLLRSYKGVEFTPAGKVVLGHARLAMSVLDKAREEVRLIRGGSGARVSVATTPLVAIDALPRIWKQFERLQPDAQLALSEGFLSSLVPALLEGRLDFAVAIADPADLPYELVVEPLAAVAARPAGRRGHPLAKVRSWEGLRDASWVMNLSAGSQSDTLLGWLRERGLTLPRKIVKCSSPMLMAELMRRTDMVGFCPEVLLDDKTYSAGLQRFEVRPLPPPMTLGLIRLRGIPLGSAAQQLAVLFRRYFDAAAD